MDTVKTEIVESKEYKFMNKFYTVVFLKLGIASTVYIFLLHEKYPNLFLTIASFAILLYLLYILIQNSLIKPKTVGSLLLTNDSLNFQYGDNKSTLNFSAVKQLKLFYTGYGSWNQYIWGNKNYLEIESTNGKNFKFEFRIKDKNQKNKLKTIFQNTSIYDRFKLIHQKHSKHRF